jgi:hypothetical protein
LIFAFAAALFTAPAKAGEMAVGELVQTPLLCTVAGITMVIGATGKGKDAFLAALTNAAKNKICMWGRYHGRVQAIDQEFVDFDGQRVQVLKLENAMGGIAYTLNAINDPKPTKNPEPHSGYDYQKNGQHI